MVSHFFVAHFQSFGWDKCSEMLALLAALRAKVMN
jgi:hypothetical protein